MAVRELSYSEAGRLVPYLEELAAYHNEVSVFFKGKYPKNPVSQTIASFEEDIKSGSSKVGVIECDGEIAGFCKIGISGIDGKVDYLIVSRKYRKKGFGAALMDWATDLFKQSGVSRVEVRVVNGNDAVSFYERCGFKINSHILRMDIQ